MASCGSLNSTVDKDSRAKAQLLKLLSAQLSKRPWYPSSLLCHFVKQRVVKGSEKFGYSQQREKQLKTSKAVIFKVWGHLWPLKSQNEFTKS